MVSQVVLLNGSITVDGTTGAGGGAGAGSGGSIWITTSLFYGSGTISSHGGLGTSDGCLGGGGAGGRIAVYFDFNQFNGTIAAVGGHNSGSFAGGAGLNALLCLLKPNIVTGTIYLKSSGDAYGKLYVNNGGNAITTTSAPSPVRGIGSITWITESGVSNFTFDSVTITGNGELAINPTGLTAGAEVSFIMIF